MKPKYITIGTETIAYYESGGTGPCVLFVHGNSFSALSFRPQLESPTGEKYRFVALDLPGHGLSSLASDPKKTYSLPGYAKILCAFTEALGLNDSIFVGWSMGGHIVLEATSRLKDAKGFMIFGTPPVGFPPPMEEAFLPSPSIGLIFQKEFTKDEARTFASSSTLPGEAILDEFVSTILAADGNARELLGKSVIDGNYTDEVEIVKSTEKPFAIVHGELEWIVNIDYLRTLEIPTLWKGEIQLIPGAGHAPNFNTPDRFNALLEEFIEDCR